MQPGREGSPKIEGGTGFVQPFTIAADIHALASSLKVLKSPSTLHACHADAVESSASDALDALLRARHACGVELADVTAVSIGSCDSPKPSIRLGVRHACHRNKDDEAELAVASRAIEASGSRSTDAVSSDHGFLSSLLTLPSSRILRRSLASGGRRMYLHKDRRPCWSLAVGGDLSGRVQVEATVLGAHFAHGLVGKDSDLAVIGPSGAIR